MNILSRYGIKEVADVSFYQINDDGSMGAPVLYLDSLKVSTIEQTAESTSAKGGKGNVDLVMWDYGREITVTLEDALFSAKSMALMFGSLFDQEDKQGTKALTSATSIYRTVPKVDFESVLGTEGKAVVNGSTFTVTDTKYYDENGDDAEKASAAYAVVALTVDGVEIAISSDTFPGTYTIIGDKPRNCLLAA